MPKEGRKRNYRKEYDNYHSSPEQKKNRAARNASRAALIRSGKAYRGHGKAVHHKDGNPRNTKASNLRVTLKSKNRSFRRNKNAGKA